MPRIPLFASKHFVCRGRRGLYGDVVEEIGAGVGRILAALRELSLDRSTLALFCPGNGPWLPFQTHGGSAGLLCGGKGTTFEDGMREPNIFWCSDRLAPGVQMGLGATIDLLPTFRALAGVPAPTDRVLDGYDLSGVLLGRTDKSPRDRVFCGRQEQLDAVGVGP